MVLSKENLIAASISIVLATFIITGLSSFYMPPISSICNGKIINTEGPFTQESCIKTGGVWIISEDMYGNPTGGCTYSGPCQEYITGYEIYINTTQIMAIFLGMVLIAVARLHIKNKIVGRGILYGGLLAVLYGLIQYVPGKGWGFQMMASVILGLLLIALVNYGLKVYPTKELKKSSGKK